MLEFQTNFGPEPCGLPPILPQVVAERLFPLSNST